VRGCICSYYYETVEYENKTIPKGDLEKVKRKYCEHTSNGTYTIRNNKVTIEDKRFNGALLKRVTYYVDYSVYRKSKQEFVTGSTGVILVIAGTEPYAILVEKQFGNTASNSN
jgi:hypothetical protein